MPCTEVSITGQGWIVNRETIIDCHPYRNSLQMVLEGILSPIKCTLDWELPFNAVQLLGIFAGWLASWKG